MTEKADMPGDTVSLPPTYAPSEAYSESPPPAYRRDKSSRVQIVKMVCATVVASAFIIGFFILTSNYLSSRACNCHKESHAHKNLQAAGFVEIPRVEALVDNSIQDNKVEDNKVEENKVEDKQIETKQTEAKPTEEEVSTETNIKDLDTLDDATLPSVDNQLSQEVVPEAEEAVRALVEEVEEIEEAEREILEAERQENQQTLQDIMRAQMDHMKKIKLPIDLILGNPALAGRDVNCEVERREQPLGGGIMTQAIIVTCHDNDDDDQQQQIMSGPAFPPPGARRMGPPLSLIAPIMKMLTAKAASRAAAKQLIPMSGPRFLPFPGAPIPCSNNGPFPCMMTPLKQMPLMAGPLSGPIPIPHNMPPHISMDANPRSMPFPAGLPQIVGKGRLMFTPLNISPSEPRLNLFNGPPFPESRMNALNAPPSELRIIPFNVQPSEARVNPFNAPPSEIRINPFNAPPSELRINPFNAPPSEPRQNPFNAPPRELRINPFNAPPPESRQNLFNAPPRELRINPFNAPPREIRINPFNAPSSESRQNPFNAPPPELRINPFNAPPPESRQNPFNAPPRELRINPFNAPPSELRINPFNTPSSEPRQNPFNAPSSESGENPFNAPPSESRQKSFNAPPPELRINPFNAPPFLERKNAIIQEAKVITLNMPPFSEPKMDDGPRHRMLPFPFRPIVRMSPRVPRLLMSPERKEGPISLASLHRGALPLPPQPEAQGNFIHPTPEAKSRALSNPVNLPPLRLLPGRLVAPAPSVTVGERQESGPITHMEMRAPNAPEPNSQENQPRVLEFGPPRVDTLINHNLFSDEPRLPILPQDIDIRPIPKEIMTPPQPIAIIPHNMPIAGPSSQALSPPPPKFDPEGRTGIVTEINPDAEMVINPQLSSQEPPRPEDPRKHHLLVVS
ncbi:RNA-binding protein 33 [Procambarus clarkii]|uniref:RNA-binding protein 33 n=1 Tax=Procambarus clarkii TaxID=6728 RepID=UPI003741FAA2